MNDIVRSAVFGNTGTIVSFRVSPDDAPFLQKYFDPQFEAQDIIQLANRTFVTTMTIAGEKAPAFSGKTLMIPEVTTDHSAAIIELSRERFTRPKAVVEQMVQENADQAMQAASGKQPDQQAPKVNNQQKKVLDAADKAADNQARSDDSKAKKIVKAPVAVIGDAIADAISGKTDAKPQKQQNPVKEDSSKNSTPATKESTDDAPAKPKRKRTRSRRRKKKNKDAAEQIDTQSAKDTKSEQKPKKSKDPVNPVKSSQPANDPNDVVIKLR